MVRSESLKFWLWSWKWRKEGELQLIQACENQLFNFQEFCELAIKQRHH